jgi:hemerythrin
MSAVNWNERFSVKVDDLDRQHQELFSIASQLVHAMENFSEKDVLAEIFERMLRYTAEHFTAEEEYLKSIDYPQFDDHKKEHTSFIKILDDYYKRYLEGEIALSMRILEFLVSWLKNHILGADIQYSRFASVSAV